MLRFVKRIEGGRSLRSHKQSPTHSLSSQKNENAPSLVAIFFFFFWADTKLFETEDSFGSSQDVGNKVTQTMCT
jgi:hypothetical protein